MRHERAMLIVLTYIIGFTTSFIAFGITGDTGAIHEFAEQKTLQNAAAVMTAVPEPIITTDDVGLDNLGLYVMRDGEQYFVSGSLPAGAETGPGYHVSIDRISLSHDGRLLYFCAQETFDQKDCTEYVYDVLKHATHPY